MANRSGADPGANSAATQAAAPPVKKPTGELLCTICGLTACWTAPDKTAKPAASPEDSSSDTSMQE